jgi:hypothetical protein
MHILVSGVESVEVGVDSGYRFVGGVQKNDGSRYKHLDTPIPSFP